MTRILCCAALTLVAAGACSPGGAKHETDAWQATVDTIGDTVVVHTVGGSVWGDTLDLVPEMTIGVFEGDEQYMFGDIGAFVVSATEDVYILDDQAPILRQYAGDGTHIRDIGRDGGGPGEYKRPGSLALLPDGRLLLRDPGNARINVYAPDGEILTSWRLPSGGGFNTSRRMYVDGTGNSYTMVLLEADVAIVEWTYGLARFTPAGEHTDTLAVPAWDYQAKVVTAQRENSSSTSRVPFTASRQWTFSPLGYFVGGVSDAYRIDLVRPDQPRLRIERDWQPAPVLAAEKAERERRIIENFKRNYGSWHWNGPSIPDTKPAYSDITIDEEGRIWVQIPQTAYAYRTQAEADEEEARTGRPAGRYRERVVYDVFEPRGGFLGTVRAPDDFRAYPELTARGTSVWAVTRDAFDVARLVRFVLTPMPSARATD